MTIDAIELKLYREALVKHKRKIFLEKIVLFL